MGGELNAATSRETTVVYTRVPDDHLDVALDVMTDMVFAPSLTDIDSEREVVLEEIAMVDDNPQDLVHDLAAEAVFGYHPLGRPVIGRAEVISSISRRSLLGYHRSAYSGPNVVLAAAGNVDHKRIVAALRKQPNGGGATDGRAPPQAGRPAAATRRSGSSASAPSSTTSASPAPGSAATIHDATPRRCSTRSSAARRHRGCSRRSARSAAWPTPSTPTARSTSTPVRSASTSARAKRTCASAST